MTPCTFFSTIRLAGVSWDSEKFSAASAANSRPSTRSLMRLVPTVTVLAWCLMASTGRARKPMAPARRVEQRLDHVGGGAFQAEVKLEVGGRQAPGQVFGAAG